MTGVYMAEYIWIDGYKPLGNLRSKTKIVPEGEEPPLWGFDGSSTEQAPGDQSDCVLKPVLVTNDPMRGGNSKLVMCEVMLTSGEPHPTNSRAQTQALAEQYADHAPLYGIEQEYTIYEDKLPLGWPERGFPAPQGRYYCGIGAEYVYGREIADQHMEACIEAGLSLSGINAEVMPGQWEFQVGPVGPLEIGDQVWLARYLLMRIAEENGYWISLHPKPMKGDWNGAGCHTNFSTKAMRENYDACVAACEALGTRVQEHLDGYGEGYEHRLTGKHETASYMEFRYGVSDRGASVRIPWQVERDGKGYIEDRRPNANIDPYVVSRLMMETICGAEAVRAQS